MMTEDEAKQWAVALIEMEVQRHIAELDSNQLVGFEDAPDWPDETEDLIVDLIDTATCIIEVDWPPRVKGRVGGVNTREQPKAQVVMCKCGCGMTYVEAVASARANSGWLSPDQAEADVRALQRVNVQV